jgi:hypothetical protein
MRSPARQIGKEDLFLKEFRRKVMVKIFSVAFLLGASLGSSAWAVEPSTNLSRSELKTLIQTATTPADHTKLANYYRTEAMRLQAEVKDHEEMAASYDKNPAGHPVPKGQTLGAHCRNLAKDISAEAKEASAMATMHEEMAKAAK